MISGADIQSIAPTFRDKHTRYVKITDSSNGRVASYAHWGLAHPSPTACGGDDAELKPSEEIVPPKGANTRLMKALDASMDEKREPHKNKERDYSQR